MDFRGCPLAKRVAEKLLESPWMQRRGGVDHFLFVGFNYAMDYHLRNPKIKNILANVCRNCTKFAIDDYSYLYASDVGLNAKGDNWAAVPFPSDFHWTKEVVPPFPWEMTDRPVLCSYVGTTMSFWGISKRLRTQIVRSCRQHPHLCVHQTYGRNGTRESFAIDAYDPLELSRKSVFCFQPSGDMPTRKGLFDAMLQGCIPVTFSHQTATTMYTWHWTEEFWKEVSIEFDFAALRRGVDPVLELQLMMQHNASLVAHKQKLLRDHVFELHYALDSIRETSDDTGERRSASAIAYEHWPHYSDGRPMRDAFDITIDHVLGWHSGDEPRVRKGTIYACWDGVLDTALNKCVLPPTPSPDVNETITTTTKHRALR